jgi:hypothetical protein
MIRSHSFSGAAGHAASSRARTRASGATRAEGSGRLERRAGGGRGAVERVERRRARAGVAHPRAAAPSRVHAVEQVALGVGAVPAFTRVASRRMLTTDAPFRSSPPCPCDLCCVRLIAASSA